VTMVQYWRGETIRMTKRSEKIEDKLDKARKALRELRNQASNSLSDRESTKTLWADEVLRIANRGLR
jgi:F0F1-type ATP synthase membrane subunit b/b'